MRSMGQAKVPTDYPVEEYEFKKHGSVQTSKYDSEAMAQKYRNQDKWGRYWRKEEDFPPDLNATWPKLPAWKGFDIFWIIRPWAKRPPHEDPHHGMNYRKNLYLPTKEFVLFGHFRFTPFVN